MKRRNVRLSRTAGAVVAGVVMAGAGVGVAVAGTAGDSNQYTPGAKPYAGVRPNDITIGTLTIPDPLMTTTIAVPTVTVPYVTTILDGITTTITVPYTTTQTSTVYSTTTSYVPTTTTVTNSTTSTVDRTQTQTVTGPEKTSTVTTPYTTTEPGTTKTVATTTPGGTVTQLELAYFNDLLKTDLRQLLQPPAADLTTAKLAKLKKLSFAFVSPGAGTLKVIYKLSVKGSKAVNLVSYSAVLKKSGNVIVTVPFTAAGQKLLKKSTKKAGVIAAKVSLVASKTDTVSVSRNYTLKR